MLFLYNRFNISFFLIWLLLFGKEAFAQDNRLQVDRLNQKAEYFYYQPDSMLSYAKKAHEMATASGYKNGEAISLKFLATYEYANGNLDKALNMYFDALTMLEREKNTFEIAKTLLSIASIYNAFNDQVNALKHGLKALKIFEQLKDSKGQGKVLNLLGIASASQGDFKRAKVYFLHYNAISKKGTDTVSLAYSYNNLGGVNRDLKLIDSALLYFKTAEQLFRKKKYLAGQALADKNIGAVYFDRKDYKNALKYASKSLQNSIISNDKINEATSYQEMGVCFRELKDTVNAYLHFKKALALAKNINAKKVMRDALASLAELDNAAKNYKTAYENLQASRAMQDSLLNTEKTKIIQELTAKYETEKKEKAIQSLQQEAKIHKLELRQRTGFLIIALSLLIMVLVLGYMIYNRRKLKEEARLQTEINRHQEQTMKSVLNAEENERIRIATDLHDGVGQLLSTALMNLNSLVPNYRYADENEKQKTENALSLVNECYDEMRSISHQMMPNALIKAGLSTAIKDFLHKIDRDKLKVSLETIGLNNRLDPQVESVLYRVIQETVNNVIKHAHASKLDIQLMKDEDGMSITIEDNGIGFDPSLLHGAEGIGLKNITSRIAFLRGTIDFDTALGKGTLVAIHIPQH